MNKETILDKIGLTIITIAFMEVVLHLIGIEVHHWALVVGTLIGVFVSHKLHKQ